MFDRSIPYALAVGAGVVTGMRSMSMLASLSRHLASWRGGSAVTRALTSPRAANILTVLSVGELAADKAPFIPNRTDPPALTGRALIGGLCGVVIAERWGGSQVGGALVGGAAAIGSTFLAYRLRTEAGARTGVPDLVWALVEDAIVVVAASRLAAAAE